MEFGVLLTNTKCHMNKILFRKDKNIINYLLKSRHVNLVIFCWHDRRCTTFLWIYSIFFYKRRWQVSIYFTLLVFIALGSVQKTGKQSKGASRPISYLIKIIKTEVQRSWMLTAYKLTYNLSLSSEPLSHDQSLLSEILKLRGTCKGFPSKHLGVFNLFEGTKNLFSWKRQLHSKQRIKLD